MKINEFFYSIQGEGTRVGYPSLFIRTSGCNMRCTFRNSNGEITSRCDTPYTSFWRENTEVTTNDVLDWYINNSHIKDIVITGGEPLIHQQGVVNLLQDLILINPEIYITIETNGSIVPCEELMDLVNLWSISPKLENSIPRIEDSTELYPLTDKLCKYHRDNRINIESLWKMVRYSNHQLKFVWNSPASTVEINNIINLLEEYNDQYSNSKLVPNIMLMPEGMDINIVTKNTQDCVQECLNNGWIFTPRMHILIWGDIRGV